MLDTIVMVYNNDIGYRMQLRGMANIAIAPMDLPAFNDYGDMASEDALKKAHVWYCDRKDTDKVVEEVSKYWANREIRVYQLTQISTRLPGDMRHKEVSKDGVLPA